MVALCFAIVHETINGLVTASEWAYDTLIQFY